MNPFEQPAAQEPESRVSVPGARGLLNLRIVQLVWMVASSLFYLVAPQVNAAFGSDSFEAFNRVNTALSLLLGVATLVLMLPFARGRRGGAAGDLAYAVVVLVALGLAVDLLLSLPELGGPSL